MAGGITDRQQNGAASLSGHREGFRPPWIPVDRIFGMLEKIWACFPTQEIGHEIPFKGTNALLSKHRMKFQYMIQTAIHIRASNHFGGNPA
jgi:hypothetical protein